MSDLRSEIVNKVLNSWENTPVPTKKSFAERVHDFVKAHPYCSINEIKQELDTNDMQSTASALKTLVDRGILAREEKPMLNYPGFGRKTQWAYYSISDEYKTRKQGYWKAKPKLGRPKGSVNKPKVEVPLIDNTPPEPIYEMPRMRQFAREEVLIKEKFNPHTFVKGLNVIDAKEVYLLLKEVFE